jgi:leucyl aminopeptidase
MWSNNKNLTEALKDSAERSGEKMWHMPLCEESYGEHVKSKLADLKNIGGKGGGSITAALFLKEFVNKSAWAHLDIAGPVWSDKVLHTHFVHVQLSIICRLSLICRSAHMLVCMTQKNNCLC